MSETQYRTFADFGLPENLVNYLTEMGITQPTPIQQGAIPLGMQEKDVIGIAQTGTGKTLAFAIPMIMNLRVEEQGLVLVPTRELAIQVEETYALLGVHAVCLIGGANFGQQVKRLRTKPEVIIATPGRLQDHMTQKTLSLSQVGIVVLDEADRMFDMGFAPAIERIMANIPSDGQTMLFSATMPDTILDLAKKYLNRPERVEIAREGTTAANVDQELHVVAHENKNDHLSSILDNHDGTVLVFTRTRFGASKLAKVIEDSGHSVAVIHSDRTLGQRMAAMRGFKSGEFRVLVATDIAARGIDVKDIALVVNFDMPENPEDYVHRIGRTGRAGASGRAITFALPNQHRDVKQIEKYVRKPLELSKDSPMQLNPDAKPFKIQRGNPGSRKPMGRSR